MIPGPAERGEEREKAMLMWSAFVYLPWTEDIQQRSDLVCQPFVHLYLQTDLQHSNPLALIFCIPSRWSSGHYVGLILQAAVEIFLCYWLWIVLDHIKLHACLIRLRFIIMAGQGEINAPLSPLDFCCGFNYSLLHNTNTTLKTNVVVDIYSSSTA